MPWHVVISLPDGRTAVADYRDPIAKTMHKICAALSEGKPAGPALYTTVAQWLDTHTGGSARCEQGLAPGGDCGHD